jgi:hypothetical protein
MLAYFFILNLRSLAQKKHSKKSQEKARVAPIGKTAFWSPDFGYLFFF